MNSQRTSNRTNIIGEGSTFEGEIIVDGTLRIDGIFMGETLSMDRITVGRSGKVKSKICADSVVVEGTILGDIESKIRTMLLPTAKILGNISTPELIIQNGVMWDGHCHIKASSSVDIAAEIKRSFV